MEASCSALELHADLWQRSLKSETKASQRGIVCEISQGVLALCGVSDVLLWLFTNPHGDTLWGSGQPLLGDRACMQLIPAGNAERYRCRILISFSALRSCAASQGQLKQWVKGVWLKFWGLCSFLLSRHLLHSVKLFLSYCVYSLCLFLSLQGSSQLQISTDSSETLFLPEQPPPPLPPPPLLPPSLTNGVALTAAKPPPTLIKVLFWLMASLL